MINTIHFPFPLKGEIFVTPKHMLDEKITKKQAVAAPETLPVVSVEPEMIHTKEQVLEVMQVQSKAFDMLKLRMARKQLMQLEQEQALLPIAASS